MSKLVAPIEFNFFTSKIEYGEITKSQSGGKKFYVRGYASTSDVDRQDEVITRDALKNAEGDLIRNSTVFFEHNYSQPIGKTVKAYLDSKGLFIEAYISKTLPKIRILIQEGILNRFSIGGRVLEADTVFDEKSGKEVTRILKLELFEVSLVGVPANSEAKVLDCVLKSVMDKARGDGQGNGGSRQGDGGADICVCPECGKEVEHKKGIPCSKIKCSKCDVAMVGKNKATTEESAKKDIQIIDVSEIKDLAKDILIEKRSRNTNMVDAFLGQNFYEQKIVTQNYSYFKLGLISKAIKEIQKEDSWICRKVVNIDSWTGERTRPIYSKLATSREGTEELLVSGYYCLEKNNKRLVVNIYPGMYNFAVAVYTNKSSSDLANNFIDNYEKWSKENNFLKGEKITPEGKFLDIPEVSFENIKLPVDKKKAIKVGALEFFKKKDIYTKNNLPFKRGLIFAGEPGTGKTFTGKILMKETDSTLIWVTAGDLITGWGTMDPQKFKMLLEMAKELAPSILFAEDIDDYLESKGAVDAIKTQMDGLDSMDGVVTILCTNYPERIPKSLIDRPSRFDDVILFKVPDEQLRFEILNSCMEYTTVKNKEVLLRKIAKESEGLTGAHLKEIVIYSILLASDDNRDEVTLDDLKASLNKVKKNRELINSIKEEVKYVDEISTKSIPTLRGKEKELDENSNKKEAGEMADEKKKPEVKKEVTQPSVEEKVIKKVEITEASKKKEEKVVKKAEVTKDEKKDAKKEEKVIPKASEETPEEIVEKTSEKEIDMVKEYKDKIDEMYTIVKSLVETSTKKSEVAVEEKPKEEKVVKKEEVKKEEKKAEEKKPERKGIVEDNKDNTEKNLKKSLEGKTAKEILEDEELFNSLDEELQKAIKIEYKKSLLL